MSLIAKDLAIKVLGGLAVGGTVIGGGIAVAGYSKEDPELKKLREEKGLDCRGNYCTLVENKSLTVKHVDNGATVTRELTAIPSDGAEGKIRVHKTKEGDKSKFIFSIEGGDITKTWADGTSISKLEEFETYEIEEGTSEEGQTKKYFFKRKTNASDEIKKLLGLGECQFPTGGSSTDVDCDLNLEKLKAINFEGKTKGKEPTMEESATAKLTITLVTDSDKENNPANNYHYPFDYIFKFSGDKEVKIPTRTGEIVKEAGGSVEFRIKVTPVGGGPRKLSLEKVWEVEKLAGKLGFTECKKDTKTCRFPEKINVYKSSTESVKEAAVTDHANKTITFEENASDYEGKVKFSLASPVSITGGNPEGTGFTEIEATNYEIKQQTVGSDTNTWYLSRK